MIFNSVKKKLAEFTVCTVFFILFLFISNSPLSDSIRLRLVFRDMAVPLYQWLLIFGFIILWKYLASEEWRSVLVKGAISGLALSIYMPMLDTLRMVLGGTQLSGIYTLYIKIFIFTITSILIFWGARIIRKGNLFLLPVSFLAVYGIIFYYSVGRSGEGIVLSCLFIMSLYMAGRVDIVANASSGLARVLTGFFKDNRSVVIFIFVFSLVLRMLFLCNLLNIEGGNYPLASDDGDTYDRYGWSGVTDPMIYIRESPHYFHIFYSVLLTVVYKIFGHSYLAAGVIQSTIGALLCCMVFILCLKLTSSRSAAILSAFGMAIDSTMIHLTTTLNNEVLYIPLIVAVISLLFLYKNRDKDRRAALLVLFAGLLMGLASIVRAAGIALTAFILPWIVIYGRDYRKTRLWKRARDAAIFLIFMLLPIIPIIYINYANTNEFFLIYNNKYYPGTHTPTQFGEWRVKSTQGEGIVPSNKRLIELGMGDPSSDPLGCIRAVCRRPKDFLKAWAEIIPRRMLNLYFWPNFGNFDPLYLINPARLPNRYASHAEFYVVLLSAAGLVSFIFSKLDLSLKMLLSLVVIYYSALHGIFFLLQSARYGAPMRPFLYMIVSFGIYILFRNRRSC